MDLGNGRTRKDPAYLITRDGFALLVVGDWGIRNFTESSFQRKMVAKSLVDTSVRTRSLTRSRKCAARSPEPEVRTPYTQGGEVRTSVVAGLLTTTSLKVAAVFGKDHARVLSRIRALGEIHAAYFGLMKCNPKLDWRLPICWLPRGLPANCRFDSSREPRTSCACAAAQAVLRAPAGAGQKGAQRACPAAAGASPAASFIPCTRCSQLHPNLP